MSLKKINETDEKILNDLNETNKTNERIKEKLETVVKNRNKAKKEWK
ncbi:hypothetical protein [Ileibacterium valens]|nr:hypothetical protein [Ileibacterium valens]